MSNASEKRIEAALLAIEVCKTITRMRVEGLQANHSEMSDREKAFEIEAHRQDDIRLAKAVAAGIVARETVPPMVPTGIDDTNYIELETEDYDV